MDTAQVSLYKLAGAGRRLPGEVKDKRSGQAKFSHHADKTKISLLKTWEAEGGPLDSVRHDVRSTRSDTTQGMPDGDLPEQGRVVLVQAFL